MLLVRCGSSMVNVPRRFSALVAGYATFTEDWTWVSEVPFAVWIQLPGAVKV